MAKGDIFTVDELKQRRDSSIANEQTTPVFQSRKEEPSIVSQVGTGIGKSAGQTVLGLGQIGRSIQGALPSFMQGFGSKGTPAQTNQSAFDTGSKRNTALQESVQPDTGVESAGKIAGDIAQFAIPSSAAARSTQGMGMLSRALAQGVVGGVVESAQEGEVGKDAATTAAISAATVPAGDLISKGFKYASNNLPEWLVSPLVKQTKTAREQGKDITSYLAKSGRVGSVDELITKTAQQQQSLNSQIDDILQKGTKKNVTVSLKSLADEVSDSINRTGGDTSADEILGKLKQISFQTRGTLDQDTIPLAAANKLRSQLDETLYQGRDYLRQTLPENREILRQFTDNLRNTVQTLAPDTRELFKQYSKEITLEEALKSAAASSNGRNSVNLMDLMAFGGGFGVTGDPVSGLILAGGRRAFESPQVKTTLAKVFTNTAPVIDVLEKSSPATRATFVTVLDEILNRVETQQPEQTR